MKTVMVVDDEKDMADFVMTVLNGAGYKTVYCENGLVAWRRLQKEKADVMVLDVNMPLMGGLELCQRVRTDSRLKNLPILMLTIRNDVEDQVAGYETGADDYLAKPFEYNVLLARVRALERRAVASRSR
jgi:DNA-binding response OmpR family regulator